jgi:flagellar basal body-associated protein FliL
VSTELVEEATPDVDSTDAEVSPEKGSAGKSRILKMGAILLGIMLVQGAVVYFILDKFVSPASEVEVAVEDEDAEDQSMEDKVEVHIDMFNTTNEVPGGGGPVNVNFDLWVTVAKGAQQTFKDSVNEIHKGRVRQAVVEVCRSLKRAELADPALEVMKRQIREKVNRVLGTTSVIDVIITKFSLIEQ